MTPTRLVFRVHALERMFERRITVDDVRSVVTDGEVIQSYPDDKPYPSRLMLGWRAPRPIHVVVAEDSEAGILIVDSRFQIGRRQLELTASTGTIVLWNRG